MRVVDLFSGAGGFSEGFRSAGAEIVWAANHWPDAVTWHSKNHPKTQHVCQDLQQADWAQVPEHDVLIASPSCQGFSRARGKDMPRHDAARSTAWAVVSCAEYHKPEIVLVENVPQFQEWVLFPAWELAMQSLGYTVVPYVSDAADHGVPQNRVRIFIVCTRSKSPLFLSLPKREHQPVYIEWDSADNWSQVDKPGRSAKVLERVKRARERHGDRCLISYYGSDLSGRSLNRPVGTITTRDRWAVIDGDRMRMFNVNEVRRAMSFPDSYLLPDSHKLAVHMLGNAVCPMQARDFAEEIKRRTK